MRHLFLCWKHWTVQLKLAARDENVQFWPKNFDIWGQKSFFCMVIAIFVNWAYHQYARGYNFPIQTTPKRISISKLWVVFRGTPLFLAVSGHSDFTIIVSTLILDRRQRNLVEPSRPSKKWPRVTTSLVWAGITEQRPFLRSAEKWFSVQKCLLSQKNT